MRRVCAENKSEEAETRLRESLGGGTLDALRSCGELRGLREENEARVYGRAEAEDRRDGNNARNGSGTGREVEGLRGGRVRP